MDVKVCVLMFFMGMSISGIISAPCTQKTFYCNAIEDECVCQHLSCIPAGNPCVNLTRMNFEDSTFTTLPSDAFVNYTQLQSIAILQQEDVVTIQENAFRNQHKLTNLYLQFKGLLESNSFTGLHRLQTLSMTPGFSTIDSNTFNGLTASLIQLYLRRGMLADVKKDAFVQLHNLTTLDLSSNRLTKVKSNWISSLSSLEILYLKANQISSIEPDCFKHMTKLTNLDLSLNALYTIPAQLFDGLISLTNIDLSGNKITTIEEGAFKSQYSLTTLYFQYNKLSTFSFADLYQENSTLSALLLNNNRMSSLVFPTYPSIPLRKLQYINLSYNRLRTFPTVVLNYYLPYLTTVYMHNNMLTCDCTMSNLTRYFTTFFGNVPNCTNSEKARCFAPSVYTNSSQVLTKLNSNVTLRCNFLGQPYPRVTWYGPKREPLIGQYNPFTGDTWLKLTNAETTSLGKYKCTATNPEGYNDSVITVVKHLEHEQTTNSASTFISISLCYLIPWLMTIYTSTMHQ
ncbi:uncharacterized protein [Antedon mediterranea]|uniref:uncharacterized protein n=1 Tax=Antedon mediterranea TaxID=105859 RepID=UPI003AF91C3B